MSFEKYLVVKNNLNDLDNEFKKLLFMFNSVSGTFDKSQLNDLPNEFVNILSLTPIKLINSINDNVNNYFDEVCNTYEKIETVSTGLVLFNGSNPDQAHKIDELFQQSQIINTKLESLREMHELFDDMSIEQKELNIETRKLLSKISESYNLNQQLNNKINESKEKINKFVLTQKNETKSTLNEISNKVENEINIRFTEISNKINEESLAFEKLNHNLSLLLSTASTNTLSHNNLNQADKEEKSANKLRIIGTIWLSIVTILTTYFVYLLTEGNEVNLELFIIRFLAVFLLTMPGVYLLKESAGHRKKEQFYRQKGTQLSTINAYLSDFESQDIVEIKKKLVTNFFTDDNTKTDYSHIPDLQSSFDKMLDALISTTKKSSKEKPNNVTKMNEKTESKDKVAS